MDLGWADYEGCSEKFPRSKAAKRTHENCWKYGFILRYQAGWEDITGYQQEEWHFRYVGRENAERIYRNEMPLETYLILLRQEVLMDIVLGVVEE